AERGYGLGAAVGLAVAGLAGVAGGDRPAQVERDGPAETVGPVHRDHSLVLHADRAGADREPASGDGIPGAVQWRRHRSRIALGEWPENEVLEDGGGRGRRARLGQRAGEALRPQAEQREVDAPFEEL